MPAGKHRQNSKKKLLVCNGDECWMSTIGNSSTEAWLREHSDGQIYARPTVAMG